ncbi:hypothetical protein [Cronobacter sakazakii]|uniref:hypothetical protein n=1 Tax=Cronobacter sakazakii TaxID=28141 RepID=UPI00163A3FA5|nr:hypothetical protein [Cronobacter sakazakii]
MNYEITQELAKSGHQLAVLLGTQHGMLDASSLVQRMSGQLEVLAAVLREKTKRSDALVAENTFLMNMAARELSTSWMFHKTMLGAQAALVCVAQGDIKSARNWLEGTTDEAGAELPDDITVAGLQPWFDSQMVSNDGKTGFLTRDEAEKAIRAEIPATDAFLSEVKAQAITSALDSLDGVFDTDCVMEANGVSYEEAEQRTTGALAVNSALIEFAAQLRQGGAA